MDDLNFDPVALSKLKLQVEKGLLKKNLNHAQAQKKSTPKMGKKSLPGSTPKEALLANGDRSKKRVLPSEVSKQSTKEIVAKPNLLKGKRIPRETTVQSNLAVRNQTKIPDLKQEILALGGDDEDINLVKDVESGSEFEEEPSNATDTALQKDLGKLMKDLPFAKTQAELFIDSQSEDEISGSGFSSTATKDAIAADSFVKDPVYSDLIVVPQSEWFNISLPGFLDPVSKRISERAVQELLEYGRELLKEENKAYAKLNSTSSSHKYYKDMMVSGTLTDKISALTLSVQESPVHNQSALDSLLALAKKRNRNQAVQVLRALKDLFGAGALLPSDRRLRYFVNQPGLSRLSPKLFDHWYRTQKLPEPLLKEHVLLWAYEDWLKSIYFEIIKILEIWSNDEITYARLRSVDYIFDLLKEKPEQETNLLHLLINKLGDPDKQVASRVSSHLVQLQIPHPFMKSVIISAIEADILFKPGATWHGKYYAIITLNQTVLNSGQQDVVKRLLDIYFSLFLSLLSDRQGGETTNLVDKKSKSTAKKPTAATKVNTKTRGKPIASDVELKEKITSGVLTGINRAFPYTSSNDDFFEKHLNTLFKITHSSNFNTSIQALMLLQQLSATHPSASDRFYRTLYESLLDARLLTTSKHTLYINLLYRSMRADTNIKRVLAFIKRLGQIIPMHQPSFVCAIIYLIKDLEDTFPSLRSLIDQPEALESDEEEDDGNQSASMAYNGKKRDPQFSNADRCCLWEMHPLTTHFHPSVSLFVSNLLSKQKIQAKPDLSLHTLINFLDRFVYRNPKKITDALKGVSLMQPMAIANTSDMLVSGRASGKWKTPALNTIDFARMKDNKVQADEVFFHKYFATKNQGKELAQKRKDKKRKNTESESEEDNENEETIWKALVDSRPELDDGEDDFDDDNDDFSDLESGFITDEDQGDELFNDEDDMDLDDDEEGALFGSDEELSSMTGDVDEGLSGRKSAGKADARGQKRRKLLKDLPTFASADEYASALQNDEDGL
ncbi:MAG: hypothetical protein GOMPHAMPRED_003504 [Gomphillus americanus]|uniref:CCAAT-binding factor domain-containing protein n=1 Tax=Gomphillus americanus TaxID=1940652 RepID=A0A8H3FIB3_9LECA|nr:MAG: hypothetical protein GOMPHAMPRED_003504 [Gomphillus americanus]